MKLIGAVLTLVLRLLAALCALAAAGALGFCIAVIVAGPLAGQPLGQVWFQHDPFLSLTGSPSIQLVQVFFERKLSLPVLWDPGIVTLLNWPSAIALAVVALGFSCLEAFIFDGTRFARR